MQADVLEHVVADAQAAVFDLLSLADGTINPTIGLILCSVTSFVQPDRLHQDGVGMHEVLKLSL